MNLRNRRGEAGWVDWALWLCCLAVPLPFLGLAFYAHPQLDDFDYAAFYERFGFIGSQMKWYEGWCGRYTFNAANTLWIANTNLIANYWLIPLIFLTMSFLAIAYFLQSVGGQFSLKRSAILFASLLGFCLYLLNMPTRSEAFYWLVGSNLYQLGCILTLVLLPILLWMFRLEHGIAIAALTLAASVLVVAIVGCNETIMVVVVYLLAAAAYWAWRFSTRRSLLIAVALLCLAGIASVIVIKAPGNLVRSSFYHRSGHLAFGVLGCTGQFGASLLTWAGNVSLLSLSVLFIPTALAIAERLRGPTANELIKRPWKFILLWLGLLWVSIFPSWYGKGELAAARTLNVTYLFFLLGWFATVVLAVAWWQQRAATPMIKMPSVFTAIKLVVVASFLFSPSFVRGLKDSIRTAPRYNREMNERYRMIESARSVQQKVLAVPQLSAQPETLFCGDISFSPDQWPNNSYAEFFDLESIWLEGPQQKRPNLSEKMRTTLNPYSIHLFRKGATAGGASQFLDGVKE